jgi:hypothetical protein
MKLFDRPPLDSTIEAYKVVLYYRDSYVSEYAHSMPTSKLTVYSKDEPTPPDRLCFTWHTLYQALEYLYFDDAFYSTHMKIFKCTGSYVGYSKDPDVLRSLQNNELDLCIRQGALMLHSITLLEEIEVNVENFNAIWAEATKEYLQLQDMKYIPTDEEESPL